jgi:hypothetical protein
MTNSQGDGQIGHERAAPDDIVTASVNCLLLIDNCLVDIRLPCVGQVFEQCDGGLHVRPDDKSHVRPGPRRDGITRWTAGRFSECGGSGKVCRISPFRVAQRQGLCQVGGGPVRPFGVRGVRGAFHELVQDVDRLVQSARVGPHDLVTCGEQHRAVGPQDVAGAAGRQAAHGSLQQDYRLFQQFGLTVECEHLVQPLGQLTGGGGPFLASVPLPGESGTPQDQRVVEVLARSASRQHHRQVSLHGALLGMAGRQEPQHRTQMLDRGAQVTLVALTTVT